MFLSSPQLCRVIVNTLLAAFYFGGTFFFIGDSVNLVSLNALAHFHLF